MNRKWIAGLVIYLGLITVCCVVLYAVPSVRGMLEKTYIAEYGRIDVTDEVSAFIVRDETVYTAETAGDVNRLAEADKLIKGDTRTVELVPDPKAGRTSIGTVSRYNKIMSELGEAVIVTADGCSRSEGYVSYYVDGAEAKFNSAALNSLGYKDYKALRKIKILETPDSKCMGGEPLFKITRNGKWYLVYYISNKKAEKYEAGDIITAELNGISAPVTVSRIRNGKKYSKITLSCKNYFDGLLETRCIDTKVTVAGAEGLILEDSSIVDSPDGTRGVFVKNKLGEHIYKPIKVKADDGRKCVVYSDIYVDDGGNYVETIGTYDEVVAEPTEEDMAGLAAAAAEKEAEASAEAPAETDTGSAPEAAAETDTGSAPEAAAETDAEAAPEAAAESGPETDTEEVKNDGDQG